MCSLASATETTFSLASTVDISSSSLTMSESTLMPSRHLSEDNLQNPPALGISESLQLSFRAESKAASLTGSVCNFYRVSAPAIGAARLLPSASGTSFQTLMGSAHLYQHSSTTVLSGVTGQSQIPTLAASNPGHFQRAPIRGPENKSSSLRDFTVTIIEQDTAVSFMSMASLYDKTSDANNMAPLYPFLSASLVQGAPSHIPNQGHSLSLPYQGGSQLYYYNQGPVGPLLSGEHGPFLQAYGSVSYTESRASAPQPEMVMVLQEGQPTDVMPPACTFGICYSVSAQPITKTSFQVMDTSLGLQLPGQTFYRPHTAEFPKSCSSTHIQILERKPSPDLGDTSVAPPVQSPANLLPLPPASSQEQKENQNGQGINTKLSKPLDADKAPAENQDLPLLPLETPDIHQALACTDPLGQEEQPDCEKAGLGHPSLSLKDQGTLEKETDSNESFADIATLVEVIRLPQVLNSLEDLDQPKGPKVVKNKETRAIKLDEVQKKPSVIRAPSDKAGKSKHRASESVSDAPRAKIKPESPDCVFVREVAACELVAADRASLNRAKHSDSKPQKSAPNRPSKTKGHGQENTKTTKGNISKRGEERKQPGNKVKAEGKTTIPKRKQRQPELTQENFKKPRSSLGRHMLESVQVFHALGKKSDKKTELSSSRVLGNSSNPKGPQPRPALKRWLDSQGEGKGPEKTQVKRQKPDGSAEKESSPSQYKLPSPGKVKLVPLLFPTVDKPQARPVPRRPQSVAPCRPAVANSARPGAVHSSRPTPASVTGPARPARPDLTTGAPPGLANPARPRVPQPAAAGPAPSKTSSGPSFHREPVRTAVTQLRAPLKPQNRYLLQDFALQPIPWRRAEVLGPVVSTPITNEQRPEREAMRRQAQLERERAAKGCAGQAQHFSAREKEMEISLYYGYAM